MITLLVKGKRKEKKTSSNGFCSIRPEEPSGVRVCMCVCAHVCACVCVCVCVDRE